MKFLIIGGFADHRDTALVSAKSPWRFQDTMTSTIFIL